MPKRVTDTEFPAYCDNGGYARVWIDGQAISLGRYGSPESKERYNRIIGEWLANGRRLPDHYRQAKAVVTCAELMRDYLRHCQTEYIKRGVLTREYEHVATILKITRALYETCPVEEFTPLAYYAIRDGMISKGLTTVYVNQQMSRLVRMFRWGVETMRCPPHVWQTLQAIRSLKAGRQGKKSRKVLPASETLLEGCKSFLSRQVRAMVDLQLLTGARPGEILGIRTCDVDTSRDVWQIDLVEHKTADRGHSRTLLLGPKAQEVIKPFLRPVITEYLFQPREALEEIREGRAGQRKTPLNQGNRRGVKNGKRPAGKHRTPPGDRYDLASYRRAIWRACEHAFPPEFPLGRRPEVRDEAGKVIEKRETAAQWSARLKADPALLAAYRAWHREHRMHPHQLRHSAATRLANEHGLEMARVILGHGNAAVTLKYAELESKLDEARKIMQSVG